MDRKLLAQGITVENVRLSAPSDSLMSITGRITIDFITSGDFEEFVKENRNVSSLSQAIANSILDNGIKI